MGPTKLMKMPKNHFSPQNHILMFYPAKIHVMNFAHPNFYPCSTSATYFFLAQKKKFWKTPKYVAWRHFWNPPLYLGFSE